MKLLVGSFIAIYILLLSSYYYSLIFHNKKQHNSYHRMNGMMNEMNKEVPLSTVIKLTSIPVPMNTDPIMSDYNAYSHLILKEQMNSSMIMIILSGIPGSGKSTFAKRLIDALPEFYRQRWDVYNQDVLGSRKKVEISTIESLRSRRCVIIDRCNFDNKQRKTWIDLGHHYHVKLIVSVVVPDCDNVEVCSSRAFNRGNDGIHEDDVNWNMVCQIMKANFRLPTLKEGMNCIYQCKNESDVISLIEEFQLIANR